MIKLDHLTVKADRPHGLTDASTYFPLNKSKASQPLYLYSNVTYMEKGNKKSINQSIKRMTRDYTSIVRSIYITNDQVAIVCFQTNNMLLQQTVKERYKVGLISTLYDPINPSLRLDVGYNTALS